MANPDQIVALQLSKGLNTKTDGNLTAATDLLVLENGEFTKQGKLRKRSGYKAVTPTALNGTTEYGDLNYTIQGTTKTLASRDNELLLVTDSRLYTYDPTQERVIRRARYAPVTHTFTGIDNTTAAQLYPAIGVSENLRVSAWIDSRSSTQLRISVYHKTTGAPYVSDYAVTTGAGRPHCIPLAGGVMVLWALTASNRIDGIFVRDSDVLGSYTTSFTVLDDLETNDVFSATTDGEYIYLIFNSTNVYTPAGVKYVKIDSSGSIIGSRADIEVGVSPDSVDIAYNPYDNRLGVIWARTGGGGSVKAAIATPSDGTMTVPSALSVGGGPKQACAAVPHYDPDNGPTFTWLYENNSSEVVIETPYDTITKGSSFVLGSGFTLANGIGAVIIGSESATGLQYAYYMYSSEGNLLGQIGYQTGVPTPSERVTAKVFNNEGALPIRRRVDANDGIAAFSHQGIGHLTLDPEAEVYPATVNNITYLTGSMLWAYDGQYLTEAAPLLFPEVTTGSLTAGTASTTNTLNDSSSYSYRVYYVFPRKNGSRVFSAAVTVTKSTGAGGGATNDSKMTLVIPTLKHTLWQDSFSAPGQEELADCYIAVYRTTANSTNPIYYRVSSPDPAVSGINGFIFNNPEANTVSFTDEMSDTTAQSKEIDYQTTGEIANFPCPGPAGLSVVGNRVFAWGGAIPENSVAYSKLFVSGDPLLFSPLLTSDSIQDDDGRITAVGALDSTPIVFKRYNIAVLAGEGPDNTGTRGAFEARPIASDVGALDKRSILRTPQGLMFQSGKGIYLLEPALGLGYIGAPVEDFNHQTVVGSAIIPDTTQAVFVCSDGNALMYDYQFGQWSTFTGHVAKAMTLWNNTTVFLKNTDEICIRDTSRWDDGGGSYALKFMTGSIRLDDLVQKFTKFKRLIILGNYFTPHKLQVGLYYNRDPFPYETWTWDPTTVLDTSTWGDESVWGPSSGVWGGDGQDYQHEHKPMRMKNAVVRIEIKEIPGEPPGRAFEISEIAIRLGVREALQKLPATRKY